MGCVYQHVYTKREIHTGAPSPSVFKGSENGCGHMFNAKSGRGVAIRKTFELGKRGNRRFIENVQATSLNARSQVHSPRPTKLTNDNVDHAPAKVEIHENSAEFLQFRLFPSSWDGNSL